MKKSAIAAGFAAALFGLAAPASADGGLDHINWLNEIQQKAEVGAATSTFGNGR